MLRQLRRVGLIAIAIFAAVQMATTQIVGPDDGGSSGGGSGGSGGSGGDTSPVPGGSGTGATSANCQAGPGTSTIPGSFIYDGGGAKNFNNGVTCFAVGDGAWETVTTSYGQYKKQSLADKWPDGLYFVEDNRQHYNYITYEGYKRVPVNDTVELTELDGMDRVARSSAPAVVEVFGDRCFKQSATSTGSAWTIVQMPTSGFFVNDRVVVAGVAGIRKLEFNEVMQGWGEAPFPQSAFSCDEQEADEKTRADADQLSTFEEGAGPFIRLFDGRWASGKVLATNDFAAVIELERVTSDGNTLVSSWDAWNPALAPGDALPLSPSSTATGTVLTIHNPNEARANGGWFMTTGPVVSCDDVNNSINANLVALDLYTDRGSPGAPVLDEQGYVIGIIDSMRVAKHPDSCKSDRYRGKNSLGILSDFLASPNDMAGMIPVDGVRSLILGATSGTATVPAKTDPTWVLNPEVTTGARFEVIDWGEDFTPSGFPKSELTSVAFDVAKQATLMFTREDGCVLCKEEAERTNDFSVMCMCTGFAVTNYLIVTNDHCVPALNLGDKTTFRSFYGQDVEAELIGKSSIDGVGTDIHGRDYDPMTRGDVALLRTKQRMDLTPVKLGDSDLLQQYDPVLSVGHPAVMARTGPFVTTVGHVLGHNVQYPKNLQYQLPAHKGASGSGVFNLDGEVIGQVANGGHYYQGEMQTSLITQYGRRALTIDHDPFFLNLNPIPFEVSPYVPISRGNSTGGAPSNYIRQLVEQWAPGELAGGTNSVNPTMEATALPAGFVDIRSSPGATEDQDSTSALERSVCDITPDTMNGDFFIGAVDAEDENGWVAPGPNLTVITVPLLDPMYEAATKCIKVFGVMVIANREGPEIPDRALQHAAAVTAEYLDNDGDGMVDDPPVNGALVEANAAVLLVNDQRDDEKLFQTRFGNANDITHAMLSVYEIPPHQGKGYGGNFYDSSLEEIFHLITDVGYATVYDDLNPEGNSKLTAAMDVARGGKFLEVPEQYPDDAWLTYTDAGCAYKCQASEYLHWLLSSALGGQAHRCDAIAGNWQLCTRELLEKTDTAGFALVTNPDYNLPTVLPDGGYPNVAYLTVTHLNDRPDLTPKLIPVGDPLHGLLHKYVNVFGMSILAVEGYPDEMLSHVATITAEYLDNNEDGQVDNAAVNASIAQNHGTVVLVTVDGDGGLTEWFAVRDDPALEYIQQVVLIGMHANKGGTQCGPECGELPDSALEHVPEVMQTAGYAKIYDDFKPEEGSRLALAIDAAKGGTGRAVPDTYPEDAWYTPEYHYGEQFVEYFYHGLGTRLGLYGDTSPGVCADYAAEWKVCTRAELETTDTRMWSLLTDEQYKLPSVAPDGVYGAPTKRWVEEGIRLDNDRMGYTGVIADTSSIKLSGGADDGNWRMYVFTGGAIRSVIMTPGAPTLLRVESGTRLPEGYGQPRVIELADGRFRLFATGADGIRSAISDDGLSFVVEDGLRVSAASVGATSLTGPSNFVKTSDGRWRMYFSELPIPAGEPSPAADPVPGDSVPGTLNLTKHSIYSASSDDLETWVVDEGVRIGTDATLTGSGEHPAAIANADGSVSIFYFRNDTKRLMVATSEDGLSFTTETETFLSSDGLMANDPDIVRDGDGTVRIIYNSGTDAGGWIYSASHPGDLPW